jgi:acetolactate synthase I/II/III large subunit
MNLTCKKTAATPEMIRHAFHLAQSFGPRGYLIHTAAELLPTLKKALAADTVSVIACPVDYAENTKLTEKLGHLTGPL